MFIIHELKRLIKIDWTIEQAKYFVYCVQACRGTATDPAVELSHDAPDAARKDAERPPAAPRLPVEADFLIGYSSVPGSSFALPSFRPLNAHGSQIKETPSKCWLNDRE